MKRADAIWVGVLTLAFVALVGPLVAMGVSGKSETFDETRYHLPVIQRFAADLPEPDLVHYNVAMTPAWHLTMAAAYRATGGRVWVLRVINAGFGLAVVLLLYAMARRFVDPAVAAAFAAPVLTANYLIGASSALTTDNAAWAGALATILFAVLMPASTRNVALAGLCATWTVLVRQVFIWLVAPIGLAGVCATGLVRLVPRAIRVPVGGDRRWAFAMSGVGVLAPIAAVAGFAIAWGGLVPDDPEMTSHFERGFNGATFAFTLTLAGLLGLFVLPVAWAQVRRLHARDPGAWLAVVAGILSAAVFPTVWRGLWRANGVVWHAVKASESATHGRIEEVNGRLQMVGAWIDPIPGRSGLLMVAAPFGALVVLVLYRAARAAGRGREAAILLLTLLGFVITQAFNIVVAQRYYEPVVLSGLLVLGAMAVERRDVPDEPRPAAWWAMIGPLVLATLQFGLTVITTYREAFFR